MCTAEDGTLYESDLKKAIEESPLQARNVTQTQATALESSVYFSYVCAWCELQLGTPIPTAFPFIAVPSLNFTRD